MKDMRNARFVETLVPFNDMKAFVCENRADQKLFSNTVLAYFITLAEPPFNSHLVCTTCIVYLKKEYSKKKGNSFFRLATS